MTRRVAARPAHVRTGSMEPWPDVAYRCTCGETVVYRRTADNVNDWSAETIDGQRRRRENSVAGLRNVPQDRSLDAWLVELRAQCATDPRAAGVYSQLLTSLQLGQYSTWHNHRAAERIGPRPDRDPPFCCGQPMRWAPDGWTCRA